MNYEQLFTEFGFERVDSDMVIINDIITKDLNADDNKELKTICTTVASHKTMMRLVLTALIENIEFGRLMMLLENWTKIDEWIKLTDKEYVYPTYMIAPDLVSWDKIVTMEQTQFFFDGAKTLNIPGIVNFVARKIDLIKFYENFDYGKCFASNNNDVEPIVEGIKNQRENTKFFMRCIPVWQPGYEDYFVNQEPKLRDPEAEGAGLWRAEPIASQRNNYKPPVIGERSVVTREEFERRFYNDITHGVLLESINPELQAIKAEFPYDHVIFSGDCIRQALDTNYDKQRASDVDIFIIGFDEVERNETFKKVLEWFTCKGRAYYGIKGGVVCVYIKDVPVQFQIINTSNSNGVDIINRFDLSHIQWFAKKTTQQSYRRMITAAEVTNYVSSYYTYEGLQVYGTYAAFISQVTRVTQIVNRTKVVTPRLIKALIRGFHIEHNKEIRNNVIDITSLVERPKGSDIRKHLLNQATPWYPYSSDAERFGHNAQDERDHILRMVERETQATEVTDDPLVVDNKTTRNINFEVEYDSLNYSRFNSDSVINNGRQRGKVEFTIKNKNDYISFIGGICEIIDVSNEDGNIDIRMKIIEQPFKVFIKEIIEVNILRRFTQKALTKNLLSGPDEDIIEMRFDKFKYEKRLASEHRDTCARTNRGAQINLEEDLNPGDHVSPMFQVMYNINENPPQAGRDDEKQGVSARLVPLKIIKIEEDKEDTVDETVEMNNQELEAAKAENPDVSASATETVYEEVGFE